MKGGDYSAVHFCGVNVVCAVYATCCGHFLYLMLAGYSLLSALMDKLHCVAQLLVNHFKHFDAAGVNEIGLVSSIMHTGVFFVISLDQRDTYSSHIGDSNIFDFNNTGTSPELLVVLKHEQSQYLHVQWDVLNPQKPCMCST